LPTGLECSRGARWRVYRVSEVIAATVRPGSPSTRERTLTRVIALSGHKGGIGKSTTCVNLAAGLARKGQRTLLVDADAQADATFMFMQPDEVQADLRDVITGRGDGGVAITDAIQRTRIEGLDLLPATLDLARLDTELVSITSGEIRVARALEPIVEQYDFILIDQHASLSTLNVACLVAATDVIVPVDATKWGTRALVSFVNWFQDFRAEGIVSAGLLGVVVTKFQPRTRIGREVMDGLRGSGLPVFTAPIPLRVGAEDNVGDRLVTGDEGVDPDMGAAYADITREVLERVSVGV
jgi:chromosome partitioning protein